MKFSTLSKFFKEIEETSSRLTITRLLSALFKNLNAKEIDKTIYLLQGRVSPLYEPLEFGIAEKTVIKSVVQALNIEKKFFKKTYQKIGDIGKAVEDFKKLHRSFEKKDLTVGEVFEQLHRLAKEIGTGSQEVKINILSGLVRQLDSLSCRYLVRIPLGILRLGFSDMTVLDAFSWMLKGDKSLRPIVEKAYHVRPDLGALGALLKKGGIRELKHIRPKLFTPILMMRAERLSSAKEIIEKIGRCAVEPKYDGFRLQIHAQRQKEKEVRMYSRNLEDVSYMYPDLIDGIKKQIQGGEVILEGEAIGFDPATGSFLPFQDTAQRKRKYNIQEKAKEIPLKLFTFELLYLNGKTFLNKPFSQRKAELTKIIKTSKDPGQDTILVASEEVIDNEKKLEILFEESISKGLEGVVAKKLTGVYQPGARGWNWIKFKRSYSAKIEDTIDTLIMGYDFGKGRRAGFGIGAFLVGIYDEEKDMFVTVAKIGTGLSDEEWRELKVKSEKLKVKTKPALYDVDKQMYTDVWIKPTLVVEIKADEITRSPVHTAGRKMKPSKSGTAVEVDIPGFALRFPRLEHFRPDKRPEDATSVKEIEALYKRQRR